MTRFMTVLPLCAALAVLAPMAAFAQTEPTQEPAAEATTTETAPAAEVAPAPTAQTSTESLLSLGEDVNEIGQPYTRDVNEAWEMRCIRAEEGVEPCQMYQMMDDGQGAPVAEISLFRLPAGGQAVAGATVIVPLETSLTAQLTISIDGDTPRRYPYAFCNPVGCYVRLGLTAADVAAFKRGNEAVLTIIPAMAPDQTVQLPLSLKGFTASYDAVSVLEQ
jgi:invasion protein IalB